MNKKAAAISLALTFAMTLGTAGCGKGNAPSQADAGEGAATQEAQGSAEASAQPAADAPDVAQRVVTVPATEENVRLVGRTCEVGGVRWLPLSGSAVEFTVRGTSASVELAGDEGVENDEQYRPRYAVLVDGQVVADELLGERTHAVALFAGEEERTATVEVIHLSEAYYGAVGVAGITVDSTAAVPVQPTAHKDLLVEFVGDSITCGYGVEAPSAEEQFTTSTENFMKSWAYLAAQELDAEYSAVSFSGYGILSGHTELDEPRLSALVPPLYPFVGEDAPYHVPWDFSKRQADVIVINLGTNDATYIKGDEERAQAYAAEYAGFLSQVRAFNPDAHIMCTLGIMGVTELYPYVEDAVAAYTAATGDTKVTCYLATQQDVESDGAGANWHPSEATQQKAAHEVAEHIRAVLG